MGFAEGVGPVMTALGHAVLHSLWQGAAIAGLGLLALAVARGASHRLRHGIGLGASVTCLVAFLGTFAMSLGAGGALATETLVDGAGALLGRGVLGTGGDLQGAGGYELRRVLAGVWILGVMVTAWRCRRGCLWAQGMKRSAQVPEDGKWQSMVDALCEDLGLKKTVRLLQSVRMESPAVIGWLRPVIVVPVAALTGLSLEQLRCVLAHELAHIQRRDHWINALLALIEMALFFHPAVWWLVGLVRQEREHCCDQTAVRATGNPRLLARALTELETLRISGPAPVLAARSDQGPLMQRVTQILAMNTNDTPRELGRMMSPAFLLTGLLVCAGSVRGAVAEPLTLRASSPALDTTAIGEGVAAQESAERRTRRNAERVAQEASESSRQETKKRPQEGQGEGKQKGRDWALVKQRIVDVLQKLDTNKDKAVSQAEAGLRWSSLASADANKDGKVTAKEMAAAWGGRGAEVRTEKTTDRREEARLIQVELDAMVAAGRLTKADAQKRMEQWKKSKAQQGTDIQADIKAESARVKLRLKAGVEAGKLTQAEADARYAEWQKSISKRREAAPKTGIEGMIREVQAAVEAGRMTPAEGKAKIEAYRKGLEARKVESERRELEMKAAIKKMEAEVAAGRMSKEEMRKKLGVLRSKLGGRRR